MNKTDKQQVQSHIDDNAVHGTRRDIHKGKTQLSKMHEGF
jgi:hypothetical protein